MATKGAMKAARAIIQAAYNGKDRLGQPMTEQEYQAGANIIDRETGAAELYKALEWLIDELGSSSDPNRPSIMAMTESRAVLAKHKES